MSPNVNVVQGAYLALADHAQTQLQALLDVEHDRALTSDEWLSAADLAVEIAECLEEIAADSDHPEHADVWLNLASVNAARVYRFEINAQQATARDLAG